jgi:hypothetical protein
MPAAAARPSSWRHNSVNKMWVCGVEGDTEQEWMRGAHASAHAPILMRTAAP